MKIKLKFSSDELRVVAEKVGLLNNFDFKNMTRDQKFVWSIVIDVADKVQPKIQKLSRQLSITDHRKKHELTLKWHEADALESYLLTVPESDPFLSNLIRKITAQINQKLT